MNHKSQLKLKGTGLQYGNATLKNHRNPNRNEMFTEIVVKTSHRVIGLKKVEN